MKCPTCEGLGIFSGWKCEVCLSPLPNKFYKYTAINNATGKCWSPICGNCVRNFNPQNYLVTRMKDMPSTEKEPSRE